MEVAHKPRPSASFIRHKVVKDSVILVGGFPEPVGGVTTFVRRLAVSDRRVEEVVDVCFGSDKQVPPGYSGKYRALNSKWRGFIYLFLKMPAWEDRSLHFNFSNLKSIAFLTLLPKFSTKWILMLHHAVLQTNLPAFVVQQLLRRVDYVVCVNNSQRETYRRYGVAEEKLIMLSSYVRPFLWAPEESFRREVDVFFSARPTFIASGYPTTIYNLDWCVRFVRSFPQYQLALFVYGEGPKKEEIQAQVHSLENVRVYWDQKEQNFNYALSKATCYLRPNTKDSFGIAVADAVNYGVTVLASDVCPRYQGASTFAITTYESFESALLELLDHPALGENTTATGITPFSYDFLTGRASRIVSDMVQPASEKYPLC